MGWMKGESERGRKIGRVEEDGREGQRNGWKEGRKYEGVEEDGKKGRGIVGREVAR